MPNIGRCALALGALRKRKGEVKDIRASERVRQKCLMTLARKHIQQSTQ